MQTEKEVAPIIDHFESLAHARSLDSMSKGRKRDNTSVVSPLENPPRPVKKRLSDQGKLLDSKGSPIVSSSSKRSSKRNKKKKKKKKNRRAKKASNKGSRTKKSFKKASSSTASKGSRTKKKQPLELQRDDGGGGEGRESGGPAEIDLTSMKDADVASNDALECPSQVAEKRIAKESEEKISKLLVQLAELQSERDALQLRATEAESMVARDKAMLQREGEKTIERLDALDTRVEQLEEERASLQDALRDANNAISLERSRAASELERASAHEREVEQQLSATIARLEDERTDLRALLHDAQRQAALDHATRPDPSSEVALKRARQETTELQQRLLGYQKEVELLTDALHSTEQCYAAQQEELEDQLSSLKAAMDAQRRRSREAHGARQAALQQQIESLMESLDEKRSDVEELREALKAAEMELDHKQDDYDALAAELEEREGEHTGAREQHHQEMEQVRQEVTRMHQLLQRMMEELRVEEQRREQQLQTLHAALKRERELHDAEEEEALRCSAAIKAEAASLMARLTMAQREADGHRADLQALRDREALLREDVSALERQVELHQQDASRHQEELALRHQEISEMSVQREQWSLELEGAREVAAMAERDLCAERDATSRLRAVKSQLLAQLEDAQSRLHAATAQRKQSEEKLRGADQHVLELVEERDCLKEEVIAKAEALKAYDGLADDLNTRISTLQGEVQLESVRADDLSSQLVSERERVQAAQREIEGLEQRVAQLRDALQEAKQNCEEARRQEQHWKEQFKANDKCASCGGWLLLKKRQQLQAEMSHQHHASETSSGAKPSRESLRSSRRSSTLARIRSQHASMAARKDGPLPLSPHTLSQQRRMTLSRYTASSASMESMKAPEWETPKKRMSRLLSSENSPRNNKRMRSKRASLSMDQLLAKARNADPTLVSHFQSGASRDPLSTINMMETEES